MILAAGELLLLDTFNYWSDAQLNGPFKAARDLDLQEVLQDFLRSLEGIDNEDDLIRHSRNVKTTVDPSSYERHQQSDKNDVGDGFVAWLVKEGFVEPVKAFSFAVNIDTVAKTGFVVRAELANNTDGSEIKARSDDLPEIASAPNP